MLAGKDKEKNVSKFWIDKLKKADEIISSALEINENNHKSINPDFIYFSSKYKKNLSYKKIQSMIESTSVFASYNYVYEDLSYVDDKTFEDIRDNTNLNCISNFNEEHIRYGFCMKRIPIRSFPSKVILCKESDGLKFDRLSESSLYTFDAFIEVFLSKDKKWSYILSEYYNGWVKNDNLGYIDYKSWKNYIDWDNFLVLTESKSKISTDNLEFTLYMGSKVNVSSTKDKYVSVKIPIYINEKKHIAFKDVKLYNVDDYSKGYMIYNSKNIIKQAFKMIDEGYGWGSAYNLRDCSSFIQDIYKCFNIKIHRNSIDQWEKSYGQKYEMKAQMTICERIELMESIPPATPIYKDGHVVLYIGKDKGEYYMIHNAASIFEYDKDLSIVENKVMRVLVSPFTIMDSKGVDFIKLVYGAKRFI